MEWVAETASTFPLATVTKGTIKRDSGVRFLDDNETLIAISVSETGETVFFNEIQKA